MNQRKSSIGRLIKYVVGALIFVILFFPIALMFSYSFLHPDETSSFLNMIRSVEAQQLKIYLFPLRPSLMQYYNVLIEIQEYLRYFVNSIGYTLAIVAGQLVIAPMVAFGLSKLKSRYNSFITGLYIIILLLPFQVTMVPNFLLFNRLNLLNTPYPLILPGIFMPLSVFLLRQFMVSLPDELLDAAKIDGASVYGIYGKLVFPICWPMIAVASVFAFAEAWNMVEQPLVYLNEQRLMPLSIELNNMMSSSRMGNIFAASMLYVLPVLLLYFYFKDEIVEKMQFLISK